MSCCASCRVHRSHWVSVGHTSHTLGMDTPIHSAAAACTYHRRLIAEEQISPKVLQQTRRKKATRTFPFPEPHRSPTADRPPAPPPLSRVLRVAFCFLRTETRRSQPERMATLIATKLQGRVKQTPNSVVPFRLDSRVHVAGKEQEQCFWQPRRALRGSRRTGQIPGRSGRAYG